MDARQLIRSWQRGRDAIKMGLVCSFLTCLAGTLLNATLDRHPDAVNAVELIRRLTVGYTGSAMVVVLAFPFLSKGSRSKVADDRT